jgi:hypothetical protein
LVCLIQTGLENCGGARSVNCGRFPCSLVKAKGTL